MIVRWIQKLFTLFGVRLVRNIGRDPRTDMRRFANPDAPLLIFDVGANRGQTVTFFREVFPDSHIHCFEPGTSTYETLKQNCSARPNVHCWHRALGASVEKKPLFENSNSDMSSFLPLSKHGWGEVQKESLVDVDTIDQFCTTQNIEYVDVLKSDTQGYDLEVLKGASQMMMAGKIGQIFIELIFSDMYEGLPPIHEIFEFLHDRGYVFVTFYSFAYQNDLASWTDALFVHNSLLDQNTRPA